MTQNKPTTTGTIHYAGLFRRLFAIFYDLFLLTAILFVVSWIFTVLNSGNAIESGSPLHILFVLILVSACLLYFGWFWTHGGQTLGMQTWRIRLQREDNSDIDWQLVIRRYLGAVLSWAVFGLGFIWSLFNRKKQCWHDIITKTVIIDLR